jgi:hypothetical protein
MYLLLFIETKSFNKFQLISSKIPYLPKKIIHKKSKFSYDMDYYENNFLTNKECINLFPAGLRGYYDLGTVVFLKEFYDLSNYVICGASAGAWNTLPLTYKKNTNHFTLSLLNQIANNFTGNSIYEQQLFLKDYFLNNYKFDDFYLDDTFISVAVKKNNKFLSHLYTEFEDLEDYLDCCMASSNIPLITGPRKLIYDNNCVFDGVFNKKPFFENTPIKLDIKYDMWLNDSMDSEFYNIKNLDSEKSFLSGYNDCLNNKEELDKLFDK